MKIGKCDFKLDTLKYKKCNWIDDRFGVYTISGKQGSNKTWYGVYLTTLQDSKLVYKVKTNIHSLKIPGYNIEYFTKLKEIWFDDDEFCIYLIDEISRKYKKNSLCDMDFYAWLNQSRKTKRIVIMITQEWLELPVWLRRPVRFNLTSSSLGLITKFFHLYCCSIGDGYAMRWNKDEGEYECPVIQYSIYKRNMHIAAMYDTFETIKEL